MKAVILFAALLATAGLVVSPVEAFAGERSYKSKSGTGAKVKGYSERRGGYSYGYADSVNTYGDSRSNYGAASVYRDPMLDRQTTAGPFDHGFFFDSGMGKRGGDAPFMN
jgi:hypothetical protein